MKIYIDHVNIYIYTFVLLMLHLLTGVGGAFSCIFFGRNSELLKCDANLSFKKSLLKFFLVFFFKIILLDKASVVL